MRGAGPVLAIVLTLALLAYPSFIVWGYSPAVLGGTRLPLSVIVAGLNVVGWYAFCAVYARSTRGLRRDAVLRLFDLALCALVLSTIGAWGLPVTQAMGTATEPLKAALTHLFLDTFSEGWFVLGVLGLAYVAAADADRPAPLWPAWVAASGVPFALALPVGFVPPLWRGLASLGGAAVAVGLLAAGAVLWPRVRPAPTGWLWRLALGALMLKAAGQLAVALMPEVGWGASHGLRVLYLHLMLLGFVTLGLFTAAEASFGTVGRAGLRAMAAAVGALLATLLPRAPLWPDALRGTWVLYAAALAALGPALVGAVLLARAR